MNSLNYNFLAMVSRFLREYQTVKGPGLKVLQQISGFQISGIIVLNTVFEIFINVMRDIDRVT